MRGIERMKIGFMGLGVCDMKGGKYCGLESVRKGIIRELWREFLTGDFLLVRY